MAIDNRPTLRQMELIGKLARGVMVNVDGGSTVFDATRFSYARSGKPVKRSIVHGLAIRNLVYIHEGTRTLGLTPKGFRALSRGKVQPERKGRR